jgi:hypothetical protein
MNYKPQIITTLKWPVGFAFPSLFVGGEVYPSGCRSDSEDIPGEPSSPLFLA